MASDPHRWRILAVVATAFFMTILDVSIVNVALPSSSEEGPERNKALGVWGALGGSGAAVGVLAGGVLTDYLSWRWIFFVNIPVGIAVLLLTPRIVPESRREGAERKYDALGAVL